MKDAIPYLNFDGNAREAMTFYKECMDAELAIQTFKEAGHAGPPGSENRVLHARLTSGPVVLMASDMLPGMPFTHGNNFHISIDCETIPETERLFARFSEGGKVTMPLQDTFWGARFGMLVDKFGVQWMFNCERAAKG